MKQLTVQQAMKEGYTLCGRTTDDYKSLTQIKDLSRIDFIRGKLYCYSKQSTSPNINADSLKDLIADHMESDWGNDTGDDTEQVYNKAKELNYQPFADMINKAMSVITSYKVTDIELIP